SIIVNACPLLLEDAGHQQVGDLLVAPHVSF
ncbi:unnamed protein product, partial [marine sediment metagenome]